MIKNDEHHPPKEQLYPLSPRFRLEVSPRIVEAWRAVKLPQTDTDLDKVRTPCNAVLLRIPPLIAVVCAQEMHRQGLQDEAPRAVTQAFKVRFIFAHLGHATRS